MKRVEWALWTRLAVAASALPQAASFAQEQPIDTLSSPLFDADGDGLSNWQESEYGTDPLSADTDGDADDARGFDAEEIGPDVLSPLDTDGDGLIDAIESSIEDSDGDDVENETDPANDDSCVPNALNAQCLATDSDGDSLTNAQEDALGASRAKIDTDEDGLADAVEASGDADGDGLSDAIESITYDSDGDGLVDSSDTDSDGDGIPDAIESSTRDTDRDETPDFLDLDSDRDGIADAMEALPTPTAPPDTDNDGLPDYRDRDSDNDGLPDGIDDAVE